MRKIDKRESPHFLDAWVAEHPGKTYPAFKGSNKKQLKRLLIEEQFGLCCYCNARVAMQTSHIEHIVPQSVDRTRTLDYDNLVASCYGYNRFGDTCGHKKQDQYDKGRFISPLDDDCARNFSYRLDGSIVPRPKDNERARYTIELLNLNSYSLVQSRRAVLLQLLGDKRLDKRSAAVYKRKLNKPDSNGNLPQFIELLNAMLDRYFLR